MARKPIPKEDKGLKERSNKALKENAVSRSDLFYLGKEQPSQKQS